MTTDTPKVPQTTVLPPAPTSRGELLPRSSAPAPQSPATPHDLALRQQAALAVEQAPALTMSADLATALAKAQQQCKPAPKDAYNEFHKYHYSSAEAIIETAKTALVDTGLAVLCSPPRLGVLGSGAAALHEMTRAVSLIHATGAVVPLGVIQWPVIPDRGRPIDKAFASAITTSLAYFLRDLVQMPRADPADDLAGREDRPQPEAGKKAREKPTAPEPPAKKPAQPSPAAQIWRGERPPSDGAELEACLQAWDKALQKDIGMEPHALFKYVLDQGVNAGLPTQIVQWEGKSLAEAVKVAKAFAEDMRSAATRSD